MRKDDYDLPLGVFLWKLCKDTLKYFMIGTALIFLIIISSTIGLALTQANTYTTQSSSDAIFWNNTNWLLSAGTSSFKVYVYNTTWGYSTINYSVSTPGSTNMYYNGTNGFIATTTGDLIIKYSNAWVYQSNYSVTQLGSQLQDMFWNGTNWLILYDKDTSPAVNTTVYVYNSSFNYTGTNYTLNDVNYSNSFFWDGENWWVESHSNSPVDSYIFKYDANFTYTGINYTILLDSLVDSPKDIFLYNGYWWVLFPNDTVVNFNFNNVYVNILREDTLATITQNISLLITSDSYYNNSLSTVIGSSYIALPPNDYLFTFTSANFTPRTYSVSVTEGSTQNLTARLLLNSSSDLFEVNVVSQTYQPIEGALITIQKQYSGGSYATVTQVYTDVNGYAQYYLDEGTEYKIILSESGYQTKEFLFTFYTANSPYTWVMSSSSGTVYTPLTDYINYYYSPTNTILNQTSYTFSLTTQNDDSYISWTSVNAGGNLVNVSGSPGGATASYTANLTNNSGVFSVVYSFSYYNLNTGEYSVYSFPVNYYVNSLTPNNVTIINSLEDFKDDLNDSVWLAIIGMFIVMATIVTIIQLSGNATAGMLGGLVALVVLTFSGWLNPVSTGVIGVLLVLGLFVQNR